MGIGKRVLGALSFLVLLASVTAIADDVTNPPQPEPLVQIYRFYRPNFNHLFTTNYQEGQRFGYYEQTIYTYAYGGPYRVALHRCYVPQAQMVFLSANQYCEGYVDQGVYGYVSTSQVSPNETPLYRYYKINDPHMDHLATINPQSEQLYGWRYEGPLGYVPYSP